MFSVQHGPEGHLRETAPSGIQELRSFRKRTLTRGSTAPRSGQTPSCMLHLLLGSGQFQPPAWVLMNTGSVQSPSELLCRQLSHSSQAEVGPGGLLSRLPHTPLPGVSASVSCPSQASLCPLLEAFLTSMPSTTDSSPLRELGVYNPSLL